MLQRIQTVFLIIVIILMAASMFFNVWEYQAADSALSYVISPFGLEISGIEGTEDLPQKKSIPYILLAVLAIASITVAAIEITKFKNRLLQIKLGTLNSVILAATTILGVYLATDLSKEIYAAEGATGTFGIFIFLAPAALIFNALANRFIHRDEKLVRSVDRIR